MNLESLNESEIAQVLGKTVDIKISGKDEVLNGIIYSIIKSNNLLLCIYKLN